jgi:hypothetical protein
VSLLKLLQQQSNDLTNEDLAVLADWANNRKHLTPDPDWKRAYALVREGADTLLRRRARLVLVVSGSVKLEKQENKDDNPNFQ